VVGCFERWAQHVRLRRYRESYYAVMSFSSFMDESFDMGSKGIFAVGGLIGQGIAFFELDRKWEALRKRPDIDIRYFKASECELGCGEFEKFTQTPRHPSTAEKKILQSISMEFIGLIKKEVGLTVHGIGVVQPDFYEAIKDEKAKAVLGSTPWRLAYDLSMIQSAWVMQHVELGKRERCPVSFMCDLNAQYGPVAHEAYRSLKQTNTNASKYMGSYGEDDEKDCEPLQAADASIYEVRRILHLVFEQWQEPSREQFEYLADAHKIGLIQTVTKEELNNIVAAHKPGDPFNLDILMEKVFHADIKFKF
jgi:hypothetical protein